MNLKPAPQSALTWLPAALEVMDRNARISTQPRHAPAEDQINTGEPWTEYDDLVLANMERRKVPIREIADALRRPLWSVYERRWKINRMRK